MVSNNNIAMIPVRTYDDHDDDAAADDVDDINSDDNETNIVTINKVDTYLIDNDTEDMAPLVGSDGQPTTTTTTTTTNTTATIPEHNSDDTIVGLAKYYSSASETVIKYANLYVNAILVVVCIVAFTIGISRMSVSSSASSLLRSNQKVIDNLQSMVSSFNDAKLLYIQKLKVDYGDDAYQTMFFHNEDNDTVVSNTAGFFTQVQDGLSDLRFQRKLKIKLLQVLVQRLAIQAETTSTSSTSTQQQSNDTSTTAAVQFIWALGGHSAAAAHGNFYDESYTARLEKGLKPILQSIGINFIGRNYAMGGTNSAPEDASCTKELYGNDIDTIQWDFGMTDGTAFERNMLYFYRTVMFQKGVACFTFQPENGYFGDLRRNISNFLDDIGSISFQENLTATKLVFDGIPDTFGMTDEQINALPQYVQSLKCGTQIEDGDPYCKTMKFNDTICPERIHQVSWHPGWKWHALMGNLMALYMVDKFELALNDLHTLIVPRLSNPVSDDQQTSTLDTITSLLRTLENDEMDDYQKIKNSIVPAEYFNIYFATSNLTNATTAQLVKIIGKEPNFCHIARIPSEIRYNGILTESNIKFDGNFDTFNWTTSYDSGISHEVAKYKLMSNDTSFGDNNGLMRLAYDPDERRVCPALVLVDYKDFFFVHEKELQKKLILPNDAEVQFYDPDRSYSTKLKGVIGFCFKFTDWAQPNDAINVTSINNNQVQFTINDQRASSNLIEWGASSGCYILRNDNTNDIYFKSNTDGKFEIGVQVFEPNMYIRFSSFMVW